MHKLLAKRQADTALTAQQAADLIPLLPDRLLDLMATAQLVTSAGASQPFTCGIVNAKSGRCPEDCRFCAQSIHYRTETPVYPLLPTDQLISRAESYAQAGMDYCGFVMSGARPTPAELDRLCETAARIVARVPIKLCASLGTLKEEQALRLKQAGFTSYHHNLETAPGFYAQACPSHDFAQRAQTVKYAKAAGLRVCCGGLFGLGESWHDRLALFSILSELDVDAIPVNFLTAVPGTPLENMPRLPVPDALGIIALMRLMHPDRDIVICGGRRHVLGRFETLALPAGANGLMVGDYLTTSGGPLALDQEMLHVLGVCGHG